MLQNKNTEILDMEEKYRFHIKNRSKSPEIEPTCKYEKATKENGTKI